MYRVKEIRQKNSEGLFNNVYPLGTDGILVDMLSGLDNEQELKIGGNHNSLIEEVSDSVTRITETYYDLSNMATYIVTTLITENVDNTTISISLSKDNEVIRTKTVSIPADSDSMTITERV